MRSVDERPIGGAHVYIYTAGVRVGTSPYCPSCYLDCGKTAETAVDGSFTIESLDPDLLFRVLVVADGYEPTFVTKVDPSASTMSAALRPIDPARLQDGHVIRGRVVDPDNKPVIGATVSVKAMQQPGGGRRFGDEGDLEPLAITNRNGEFAFTSAKTDVVVDVMVEARGLATRRVDKLDQRAEPHIIHLGEGVTVRGRLVKDGMPVPNVEIGLVQTMRLAERFLGDYTIGTDRDGRFELPNIAPNDRYYIYGKMKSLEGMGAAPVREISLEDHNSEHDIGDLAVEKGNRLNGRVVLSDGQPVPPQTRILIGRHDAWDTLVMELDENGGFSARDLPAERCSISVRVSGYHTSLKNPNLDLMNISPVVGVVDRDIDNFILLLDPGQPQINEELRRVFDQRAVSEQPLRSASLDKPE